MSVNVTIAGQTYAFPTEGDNEGWGPTVTEWAVAVSAYLLQRTGGNFTLSADVNFGPTAGLISQYFKSRSSDIATAEILRLANNEGIAWRNSANDANLVLKVDGSGDLLFNGSILVPSSGIIPVARGGTGLSSVGAANTLLKTDGSTLSYGLIVNANIDASAAIDRSKVASGSNDHVVINDGTGNLSSEASLAISRGGTGQATKQAGFDALSPGTTKGDLLVHDGTNNVRQAVGDTGKVLASDPSSSTGLSFIDPPQGGRNYIPSGDSRNGENGVGDWVAQDDVDNDTVGTPAVSIASNDTTPLVGTGHLRLSTTAADNSGEGWSIPLTTIEEADRGKPHTIEFVCRNSDDYVDDDIELWVSDGTKTYQPAPYQIKKEALSSGAELFQATFQPDLSATELRLYFKQAGTNANAVDVDIDEIKVSPVVRPYGTPFVDLGAFVPTGTWSANTTFSGHQWRMGNLLHVSMLVSLSGAPTGTGDINLPSGLSIDESALPANSNVGHADLVDANVAGNRATATLAPVSSTALRMLINSGSGAGGAVNATQPFTWATGDSIRIWYTVPIAGWSSSTVMSDSADTRVVGLEVLGDPSNAIDNTARDVVWASDADVVKDSHGTFNRATGVFTVPVPGWYEFDAGFTVSGGYAANKRTIVYLNVDGATKRLAIHRKEVTQTTTYLNVLTGKTYLNAGQLVKFQIQDDSTTPSYDTTTTASWVSITKASGPAQIAASEKVYLLARSTAGQTVGTSFTDIVFGTVVQASHGSAMYDSATGIFTASRAGDYTFEWFMATAAINLSTSQRLLTSITSSVGDFTAGRAKGVGSSVSHSVGGSVTIRLNAGQTANVQAISSVSGDLSSGSSDVWLSVRSSG